MSIETQNTNPVFYNSESSKSYQLKPHSSVKSIVRSDASVREKLECLWLSLCVHLSANKHVRTNAFRRLETQLANFSLRKEDATINGKNSAKKWDIKIYKVDTKTQLSPKEENGERCKIKLVPKKTMEAAQDLVDAGVHNEDIVILDIASAMNPGGAFALPQKGTQEESICEHTDLYSALKYAKKENDKVDGHTDNFIPANGCLFIPNVPLVRNAKEDKLLDASKSINVVAAAALDFRKGHIRKLYGEAKEIDVNGKTVKKFVLNEDGQNATKDIMRAVLEACKVNGKKHLVLGALGCGAYKNEPSQVATL